MKCPVVLEFTGMSYLPLQYQKLTCSFLCNIDKLAQDHKSIKSVELHLSP